MQEQTIFLNALSIAWLQDVGVVRLIRRVAPALPVHGSTQMSITSAEGAEFARALGVERVVVGRELSVADIARVGAESHAEVEAFVHGALCVSYRCRHAPFQTCTNHVCGLDIYSACFHVISTVSAAHSSCSWVMW